MKKLLALLFILLLLTSCEKEAAKPNVDTPELNEEKVAQPIKQETTESEVVEPEIVEPEPIPEPEVTEPEVSTPEVIVLPEADENTITITIDFPETPYTEPKLVSPEEFEWGEYVPFVSMTGIDSIDAVWSIKSMAILSKKAPTLLDATKLYEDFNDKYLFEYKPEKDFTVSAGRKVLEYPDIANYLYKSKIICVNEDLSRMIRSSFIPRKDTGELYVLDVEKYDYIENGKVVCSSVEEKSYSYFYDAKKIVKNSKAIGESNFYKDCYLYFDEQNNKAELYSLCAIKMLYDISLPENCMVCDYNTNGILLQKYNNAHEIYYYDFYSKKISLVETLAFNASLSPDGNYVAYTSADYDSNCSSREKGYYIKNLNNETTVFYSYPYEYYKYLAIDCWVQTQFFN